MKGEYFFPISNTGLIKVRLDGKHTHTHKVRDKKTGRIVTVNMKTPRELWDDFLKKQRGVDVEFLREQKDLKQRKKLEQQQLVAERIQVKQKMRLKKTELEKLHHEWKELRWKVRKMGPNATKAQRRGSMQEFIKNAKQIKKSSLELEDFVEEG